MLEMVMWARVNREKRLASCLGQDLEVILWIDTEGGVIENQATCCTQWPLPCEPIDRYLLPITDTS